MKENQKIFYLITILIFLVLALVGGLFLDISFGNPQKSKWHFIFQKYYLKIELNWPKSYNGEWKEWDENGELMVSTQVSDGVMNGEQLEFYGYKNLKKKQFYKNGYLHGKQVFFDANGILTKSFSWENGFKNGIYQLNNFAGKPLLQQEYKNDILDGACINFYENGTKKLKGYFKNDMPIGEWILWDLSGNLNSKLNVDNKDEKQRILFLLSEIRR